MKRYRYGARQGVFIALSLLVSALLWVPASNGHWSEWRGNGRNSARENGTTPEGGEIIWSFQIGDQVLSSPVFYKDGMLIGSDDGNLYCMDPDTGKVNWKFDTDGSIQVTALVRDGRAYFGSFDHNLYCIELPSGGGNPAEQWRYRCDGQIISSAHFYGDSVIVADLNGTLYRIGLDGSEIWKRDLTSREIWSSATIDIDRDSIFIGDIGGTLFEVFGSNGTLRRTFQHGPDSEIYCSALLRDGVLYYTTGAGDMVIALDTATGRRVWTFRLENDVYSSPVISGDRIIFGSFEFAWCLPVKDPDGDGNITSDEIFWTSPTHDFQGGSSPLVTDGKVFIGSDDWHLYCFNISTGEELWTFETRGYIYSSASLYQQRIYFGSSDRKIYCIGDRPPGIVIGMEVDPPEITSDNISVIRIQVTDEERTPVKGALITFTPSSGSIAFNVKGDTRLEYITDANGTLIVYYFPVRVSSRSTMDIMVLGEKQGLSSSATTLQIVVEPGSGSYSGGGPIIPQKDNGRTSYYTAIMILVMVNILLLVISVVWTVRNRYEISEVPRR